MPDEAADVLAVHKAFCEACKRGDDAAAQSFCVGDERDREGLTAWVAVRSAYARLGEAVDNAFDKAWTAYIRAVRGAQADDPAKADVQGDVAAVRDRRHELRFRKLGGAWKYAPTESETRLTPIRIR